MAAVLEEGISSPEVKTAQGLINEYYQASMVAENGEFDDKLTKAVRQFQADVKVRVTGKIDDGTMKLLKKPPTVKAHEIVSKKTRKTYYVPDTEWPAFQKKLCAQFKPVVEAFGKRAAETRMLWDAHDKARKEAFFLIKVMVDVATGCDFPKEGVISASDNAAKQMAAAMAAGDSVRLGKAIDDGGDVIDKAVCAMSQYRDTFYAGGEQLVKELQGLKEGCKDALEVLAAIATGGSSVAVTAAMMGAVGSYSELLDEIDLASTKKVDPIDAFGNVVLAGVVNGAAAALMADKVFGGKLTAELGEKVGAKILGMFGKDVVKKMAEEAVKGALKGAVSGAIAAAVKDFKMGSDKVKMDDFAADVAKEVATGAVAGLLCGGLDGRLKAFSGNWAKSLKDTDFKGLGKVDIVKACKAGADKYIELAVKRLGVDVLVDAAGDAGKGKSFEGDLADALGKDAKLNADLAKLVKDKKLN